MSEAVNRVVEKLGGHPGFLVLVLLNLGIFWLLYAQGQAQHELRQQIVKACMEPR